MPLGSGALVAYELRVESELCAVWARAHGPGDREEGLRLLEEAFALARQIEACSVVVCSQEN